MSEEPAPTPKPKGTWEGSKEILALIASFIGIFITLMIFMGGAYLRGYTFAVGIQPQQLKIDLPTYMLYGVQQFWFGIGLNALAVIIICLTLIIPNIIMDLIPWERWGIRRLFPVALIVWFFWTVISLPFQRGKTRVRQQSDPDPIVQIAWTVLQCAFSLVCGIIALYVLLVSGTNRAERDGQQEGRRSVAHPIHAVTVMSKEPLILSTAISPTTTISNVLVYANLSLITYNEQRYFVFRELDPVTCRPREVFAIAEGATLGVQVTTRSVPLTGTVTVPADCQ